MSKTLEVPAALLRKMARAAEAFEEFETSLEDYLIARDPQMLGRLREGRAAHLAGRVRPLSELKKELCIE